MTQAIAVTEFVRASPDLVWKALIDWENGPKWLPGLTSMAGPADPEVGDEVTFSTRGAERSSTITALERARLLTLTSTQGPVTAHYTYALAAENGGTRIGLNADVVIHGLLRLLAPVIRSSIAKEDGRQLEALKAILE